MSFRAQTIDGSNGRFIPRNIDAQFKVPRKRTPSRSRPDTDSLVNASMPLGDWMDFWFDRRILKVAPRTYENEVSHAKNYFDPIRHVPDCHTSATLMLNAGVSLEAVSKVLGHTDVRTTAVYARVLDATCEAALETLGGVLDS